MAKIVEDILIMKFSRIVKDNNSDPEPAITAQHAAALDKGAQELEGKEVTVEGKEDGK